MSIFGKLLKTTIDIVTTPVSIIADVVTMGGAVNDKEGHTYTGDKVREIMSDVAEVKDECDKL